MLQFQLFFQVKDDMGNERDRDGLLTNFRESSPLGDYSTMFKAEKLQ